jgi:hypothetical protein
MLLKTVNNCKIVVPIKFGRGWPLPNLRFSSKQIPLGSSCLKNHEGDTNLNLHSTFLPILLYWDTGLKR